MTTDFDADIDSLIGSLHSVYAGDRGHAISDLRSSLFASLGDVALGPKVELDDATSTSSFGSAGLAPSPLFDASASLPTGRSPSPDIFAPGRALSPGRGCSRAGPRAQRHPTVSPVIGCASRRARSHAQPYATGRPRAHTSQRCNADSQRSSRQSTPQLAVTVVLAELDPPNSKARPRNRMCKHYRSNSSPLSSSAPQRTSIFPPTPAQTELGAAGPHLSYSVGESTVPAWSPTCALTRQNGGEGPSFRGPPSPSVASSQNMPGSVASSAYTSVLDLSPDAGLNALPSSAYHKGCASALAPMISAEGVASHA